MLFISLFVMPSMKVYAAPAQGRNNLELNEAIDFTVAIASLEEEINSLEMNTEILAKNLDAMMEMDSKILKIESTYEILNMQLSTILEKLTIIEQEMIKNQELSWKMFYFFIECAITGLAFGCFIGFVGGVISIVFQIQGVDSRSKKWRITFGLLFLFSVFIVYCMFNFFAKLNFPHLYVSVLN